MPSVDNMVTTQKTVVQFSKTHFFIFTMDEAKNREKESISSLKLELNSFLDIFHGDSDWKDRLDKIVSQAEQAESEKDIEKVNNKSQSIYVNEEVTGFRSELNLIRISLIKLKELVDKKGISNVELSSNENDQDQPSQVSASSQSESTNGTPKDKKTTWEKTIEYFLDEQSKEAGVFQEDNPSG